MRRRLPPRWSLIVTLAALLAAVPVALAATRPSLPALEPQLMCVTCKIPLNVADSAEATEERELIRQLIAHGKNEAQIKQEMVTQYGPSVLSTPSTKGFQLTAYLVPLAVVLALLALALTLLPRWRRAARARAQTREPVPGLTPAQTQRLEQDMKRFE
jgi:cytochrome c-type biogenesis protein CcmH/NrfF